MQLASNCGCEYDTMYSNMRKRVRVRVRARERAWEGDGTLRLARVHAIVLGGCGRGIVGRSAAEVLLFDIAPAEELVRRDVRKVCKSGLLLKVRLGFEGFRRVV
jgi:hypothetical protein